MNEGQCRLCLNVGKCPVKLSDQIETQSILEIINSIAPIVCISIDDHFPQEICATCLEKITDVVSFRSEIVKSDEILQCHDPE